jgi:hypothetical protein
VYRINGPFSIMAQRFDTSSERLIKLPRQGYREAKALLFGRAVYIGGSTVYSGTWTGEVRPGEDQSEAW